MRDTDLMTRGARDAPAGTGEPIDPDGATVGRTAALVGLSVRTLHHWDVIGLVQPSGRTWAGYRLYSAEDIARIHRVLVYREIGLPLADIARVLDDPAADARDHLRSQRSQLVDRIARLQEMVGAVDRMLESFRSGIRLTPQQQVEIFGDQWRSEWVEQAGQRWGDSPQWAQYAERAAHRSADDWREIAAETEQVYADLAAAKLADIAPGSDAANTLAERHRALLSHYFDCPHARHVCIARMFVDEPGYAEYHDAMAPELTEWLRDVVFANARVHGVEPETAAWD
ncbi:MerR family transcriptional regulator [Nocardia brasiliensis]|uniref:MerR family transcriptional regulator n=1 Tax=Nocardia brasiliensis TaxID=37326 RepID=UPI003D8AFE54